MSWGTTSVRFSRCGWPPRSISIAQLGGRRREHLSPSVRVARAGPQPARTPGVGEEMLRIAREVDPDDPRSTASRLVGGGVPRALARVIGRAHDQVMSQSILDFYRSAVPNVSAGWWDEIKGPTRSRGLVLLLPDPPEEEAMSLEVAERLGAETAGLDDLNHCWMAEAPEVVAPVLERSGRRSTEPSEASHRAGMLQVTPVPFRPQYPLGTL